jgi:2-haloacid dehalogenase
VAHNGVRERFRGGVLSVHPAKIFKPAPQVYAIAEEALGVPRSLLGFVSSNGWDAAGAKTFGFRTFWINRSGMPVERLGVRPDAVVHSLAEIEPLLV